MKGILGLNLKRTVLIALLLIAFIFIVDKLLGLMSLKRDYNLILISVDTLRPDHMGMYGYTKNTTPNIDKWAKTATVFNNAYTVFPLTPQSFYTLFSGKNSVLTDENWQYTSRVPGKIEQPSLAQLVKNYGWKTAAFITNPAVGGKFNKVIFERGFEEFNFFDTSGLSIERNKRDPKILNDNIYGADTENSEQLSKNAISWIKSNSDNRFFLWLHFTNPHFPYSPPIESACKIDKRLCNPEAYKKARSIGLPGLPRCTEGGILNPEEIKDLIALYDAELLYLDTQVGIVLDAIKKQGLDRNSIIVFYGDHGESFKYGILHHGYSLYNADVKIPLIMRLPNTEGNKSNILIDNTDILPTLLSLLNVPFNTQDFTGISFANVFKNGDFIQKNKVIFKTPVDRTDKIGVTDGKYKYIYSRGNKCLNEGLTEELYKITDLEEDVLINDTQKMSKFKNEIQTLLDTDRGTIDGLKTLGY